MWKIWALKWKLFLHSSMSVLPFSVKLHMHMSTIGAIFASYILHNSTERLNSSTEENSLSALACHSMLLVSLFYCIPCRVIHCSIFAGCSWSGVIHHPSHWNWGPYGLGVNYEAMRKVIISAETAILWSCSLHLSFILVWDNERVKATGSVFVLWIHAKGRKYSQ